jgi:hypothetical protein
MPHIPQVKTNLSGQQMGSISRGVFLASSAAQPLQRTKTGATWTSVTSLNSADRMRYAAGRIVVATNSTTGYWSTNGGNTWTTFTAPSSFSHLAGSSSGKWVLINNTWTSNTVQVTTTTDFITFATPYTITVTGATDWSPFNYQIIDWDATFNKWAFTANGSPNKVVHSTTGDSGSWTVSNLNSTSNNYGGTILMGNGYAYVGFYGDGIIQYSTNLTSWTSASVGSAEPIGSGSSINKTTGAFVYGSNMNVSGGNNPRYSYGQGTSISGTFFADAGLYGSNMIRPAYIGGGGFLGSIPNATRGASLVYTTDPSNTTWTIYNAPNSGSWQFVGDDAEGWNVVGLNSGIIYRATS